MAGLHTFDRLWNTGALGLSLFSTVLVVSCLVLSGPSRAAAGAPESSVTPRVLVLALDGVPFRVMEAARAAGAFEGWPSTLPLVAPFPSVTNVSFSSMLEPIGGGRAPGYELQHYDWETNDVTGGSPFRYEEDVFEWKHDFDVVTDDLASKLATYTWPRRSGTRQLEHIAESLLGTSQDLVLAHLGATDAMQHLQGDEPTLSFLLELDAWLLHLRDRHMQVSGRELRVVMLSDHGNSSAKVRPVGGLRRLLRKAGFRVTKELEREGDIIAKTFGMSGHAAFFLDEAHSERATLALLESDAVDIVARRVGAHEIRVCRAGAEAAITWSGRDEGLRFAHRPLTGDPLRLAAATERLCEAGLLDDWGFARDADWFDATIHEDYPDALRRLRDGLTGANVENPATILVSLKPGRAWGLKSAKLFSWLRGGRLEGTHGGLDADSSLGFFLADEDVRPARGAVRAATALEPWSSLRRLGVPRPDLDSREVLASALP